MSRVEFKPTIPVFELAKMARAVDDAATSKFVNILICVLRVMLCLSFGRTNFGAGLPTCVKYSEKHFDVNLRNEMVLASQNDY
jgi:hypothetical protein